MGAWFSAERLSRPLARVTAKVCCLVVALVLLPTACLLAAETSSTGHSETALKKSPKKSYDKIRTYWDPRRKGEMIYQGNTLIVDGPYQEPDARPASPHELMDFATGNSSDGLGPESAQSYSADSPERIMWDPHRRGTVVFQGNTFIHEGPFANSRARPAAPHELIDITTAESARRIAADPESAVGDEEPYSPTPANPNNQSVVRYQYDPFDRRTVVNEHGRETNILYGAPGDSRPMMEIPRDGKGPTVRHIWNGNQKLASVVGGQAYYYHYDGSGNVVAVTNKKGEVVDRRSYDPYGDTDRRGSRKLDDTGFAGAYGVQHDRATGLHYMRHRYYDRSTGRFISAEPLISRGFISTRNRYSYVGNNPVVRIDPLGLWYVDVSGSVTLPGGYQIGGSIQLGSEGVYVSPSLGVGVGTPISGSVTWSPCESVSGPAWGAQAGAGPMVQVGQGGDAEWFQEYGLGTPGVSGNVYEYSPLWDWGEPEEGK